MTSYTEKEAKEKWCPFYRYGEYVDPTGDYNVVQKTDNRGNGNRFKPCLCIGSDCMAWQWTGIGDEVISSELIGGELFTETKLCKNSKGYCGLAGK